LKDGKPYGSNIIFKYPDGTFIRLEEKNGVFISGTYYKPNETKIKNLKPDLINWKYMPIYPKDTDPYEKKHVYVKEVLGMGEGLFAKRTIQKGDLVSLYSGMLVSKKTINRRRWEMNAYTMHYDCHLSIDVPTPFDQLDNYKASLGHKANHSFEPNAILTPIFHPKFGRIAWIVADRDIKMDQEILVDYGYSSNWGPKWYKQARKKHKEKLAQKKMRRRRAEMLEKSYKMY
jgi:[histone H3]-lysine4 N-methyltransferase